MNKEDKLLFLIDICSKLPYGLKATTKSGGWPDVYNVEGYKNDRIYLDYPIYDEGDDEWLVESVVPYLRPMSSMTAAEEYEYHQCKNIDYLEFCKMEHTEMLKTTTLCFSRAINWLNAHHFDYYGLIEKGFALVAPEGMYN